MSSKGFARSLLKLRSLPRRVLVKLVIADVGWERKGEVKAGQCVKLLCIREGLQVNQPQSFGIWVCLVRNKRQSFFHKTCSVRS